MIQYPDYANSILNVSTTILESYGIKTPYPSIDVLKEILDNTFKHVVYVLLDGMGVNVLYAHLPKDAFLRKHLRKTITSVFPPTTVAATNVVLSGLPPWSIGYVGWVQYFKKENTNCVVFNNHDFYEPGRTFPYVLRETYLKYPTLHDRIRHVHPDIITHELFPAFIKPGYETLNDAVDQAIKITQDKQPSFTYLYWTEPDLTQHDYGTQSKETKNVMLSLNQAMEKLYQHAGEDTVMIIIADHGLTDVVHDPLFEDKELLSCLVRMPSIEPRATTFFVKRNKRKTFETNFEQHYGTYYQLMTKRQFLRSGLLGKGKKHPMITGFIGNYIAIAITNHMFDVKPGNTFKANHAGLTEDEMMVPLIVATK